MQKNYEESEFQNILFVPSAYNIYQRATTSKTPSSPRRFIGTTTPGHPHSRTPPPPPLNSVHIAPSKENVTPMHTPAVHNTIPLSSLQDFGPYLNRDSSRRPFSYGKFTGSTQTWIKVCGIEREDTSLIIRHFRQCGNIEKWHPSDGQLSGNWMFIKFESEESMMKALEFNGRLIGGTKCFGVVIPQDSEKTMLDNEMFQRGQEDPQSVMRAAGDHNGMGISCHQLPTTSAATIAAEPNMPRYEPEVLHTRSMDYNTTDKSMFGYFRRFLFG